MGFFLWVPIAVVIYFSPSLRHWPRSVGIASVLVVLLIAVLFYATGKHLQAAIAAILLNVVALVVISLVGSAIRWRLRPSPG